MEEARHSARTGMEAVSVDGRRDFKNARASLKVTALVLFVSALMGAAAWAFLAALDLVTALREAHPLCFLLLPVVCVATTWVYRTYGLDAGRGNNLVVESALQGSFIHARMAVLTFACSVATHLAGGSAGREGTGVQIGGTIAANVSRAFHLDAHDHRNLMLAGVSAAFGGIFGTPLAGAFFGMEICFIGKLEYGAALYCLIGSYTGKAVAGALGTTYAFQSIDVDVSAIDAKTLLVVLLAAVVFGLAARAFPYGIHAVKHFYASHFTNYLMAALAGSLVLLAFYALPTTTSYAGLAEWLVAAGFEGATTPLDALIKFAATVLTLGAGFQGGEVTPLFAMGASLGGWLGSVLLGEASFIAAIGMICFFGSALNVPLCAIMLAVDMFGGVGIAYFVIAVFVSYLVGGHRGLLETKRIVTPKRRSLAADSSLTVEEAYERHQKKLEELADEHEAKAEGLGPEALVAALVEGMGATGAGDGTQAPAETLAPSEQETEPAAARASADSPATCGLNEEDAL